MDYLPTRYFKRFKGMSEELNYLKEKEISEFGNESLMIQTLLSDQGLETKVKCYLERFLSIYVYSFGEFSLYLIRKDSETYEISLVEFVSGGHPLVLFFLNFFNYERDLFDLSNLIYEMASSPLKHSRRYKEFYYSMLKDFNLSEVLAPSFKSNFGYYDFDKREEERPPEFLDNYLSFPHTNYVSFKLLPKTHSFSTWFRFGVHPYWINSKNLDLSFSFFKYISERKSMFEEHINKIDEELQKGFL